MCFGHILYHIYTHTHTHTVSVAKYIVKQKIKQKSFKIEDIWILVVSVLVIATVHLKFTKIYVEE